MSDYGKHLYRVIYWWYSEESGQEERAAKTFHSLNEAIEFARLKYNEDYPPVIRVGKLLADGSVGEWKSVGVLGHDGKLRHRRVKKGRRYFAARKRYGGR